MAYKLLLFDLDGTLTDSREGITRSIRDALSRMNHEVPDDLTLNRFIGPPLQRAFQEILAFDERESALAVDRFRERYSRKGIYENKVYPGVAGLLDRLKDQYILTVATAKPESSARVVLEHFGLSHYFSFVRGAALDGTRIHKDEIIGDVLRQYPEIPKEQALMIGDRIHDIEGARSNGIDVVGVNYGYGGEDELQLADFRIDRPEDLLTLLEEQDGQHEE